MNENYMPSPMMDEKADAAKRERGAYRSGNGVTAKQNGLFRSTTDTPMPYTKGKPANGKQSPHHTF